VRSPAGWPYSRLRRGPQPALTARSAHRPPPAGSGPSPGHRPRSAPGSRPRCRPARLPYRAGCAAPRTS